MKIAVSNRDFKESGCVNCGCDFAYNHSGASGGGVVPVKCGECDIEFVILADGLNVSRMGFGTGKKDAEGKDIFAYPILLQAHPRKGIPSHEFVRPDIRPENGIGEFCKPRIVGYDLACFVKSKEAGARIVNMFDTINAAEENKNNFSCWLDYRPNEPLWIQVKIDYNSVGEHNASALAQLIGQDGIITVEKIVQARDIVWNFENMWNFITSNKIGSSVDLGFMQKLVKFPYEVTDEDRKGMEYVLKTNNNQLAMFEIYGMYLQVQKELAGHNVDRAAEVVEHTMASIDSKLYKNIQGPREYADQRVFHEYLFTDLAELMKSYQTHDKKQDGNIKIIK
ncbi:MAG: hypothetical protein PHX04_01875 [Bacilli bacterium]|nr:hypothetical protein [Bacilli bacterium]